MIHVTVRTIIAEKKQLIVKAAMFFVLPLLPRLITTRVNSWFVIAGQSENQPISLKKTANTFAVTTGNNSTADGLQYFIFLTGIKFNESQKSAICARGGRKSTVFFFRLYEEIS